MCCRANQKWQWINIVFTMAKLKLACTLHFRLAPV